MLLRTVLLCSAISFATTQARAQSTGPASPDEAKPDRAPLITATTTSLACYFKNAAGQTTWQWGLAPGNQWYAIVGSWQTTPHTKLQKFFTDTAAGPLTDACNRASSYYKLKGYTLFAYFAADGSAGYNYPIVSCGVELYPRY
jgi:hypothetical protein